MNTILPKDRNQYRIMGCLDDEISLDNPVRIIDAIIERLLRDKNREKASDQRPEVGRPGYIDTTMIKIFIYGYMNRINSSRRLEIEAKRNIELRWLIGELVPDHWTISNYRKENGEKIKEIARDLRKFLRKNDYIGLETVAIDGSKIKANTSKDIQTKEVLAKKIIKIDETIEEYLEKIKKLDETEDIEEEIEESRGRSIKGEYIKQIKELKKEIEELKRAKEILEEEGHNYISLADKEARLMLGRDGKIPAYNVQIVVDSKHKLIIDSEVSREETDNHLLETMLESIKEEIEELPENVLVDNGYSDLDTIEKLSKKYEEEAVEIYVSQKRKSSEKEGIKFRYDKERNEIECQEGKRLKLVQRNKPKRNGSIMDMYQSKECNGCLLRQKCTKSKTGRIIHRYKNQEWRESYVKAMLSKTALTKLKKRRGIIEHVFGTLKRLMGKVPLLLRGVKKVGTEINLYTTGYNIKRLINIEEFGKLMQRICGDKYQMA